MNTNKARIRTDLPALAPAIVIGLTSFLATIGFSVGLLWLAATVVHGAGPGVQVELNKLETHDGVCRAYLVLENRTESDFASLQLDLVTFDTAGIVARHLAVEMAPLPRAKTRLRVFDAAAQPCEKVARLLLNDVIACADGTGTRQDCLALLSTANRGTVPFIK